MKLRYSKKKVTKILKKFPHTRDNDMALISIVWNYELGGKEKTEEMTGFDCLCKVARKELSNPVSLWRCRQKIQQENPDLRGKNYKERQKHSKNVKSQIINWGNPDNQQTLL